MSTTSESQFADQSAFEYDYYTLQTTGVILGFVMFVAGILIALSKKLKCSKSSNPVEATPVPKTEVPPQTV
ncbi:FXYD domain containing ion transport regulator 7 isoform X2 [Clupea harengus]|uniref:FXYD domain-containing ion transport regulator n=1 Tax=Clupea harengus TaxID=7950 RepID=A0A6P8FZF3_CLUHA|nr:FXYD domain containing ion transport regulator 7 isoform X2 [Clupea harengus]